MQLVMSAGALLLLLLHALPHIVTGTAQDDTSRRLAAVEQKQPNCEGIKSLAEQSSSLPSTTLISILISTSHPSCVKVGEVFLVTVFVINLHHEHLPVLVELERSPKFESDLVATTICVQARSNITATFELTATDAGSTQVTVVGSVNMELNAKCLNAAVEKKRCCTTIVDKRVHRISGPITIEFEGFAKEITWTSYLCANEDSFVSWHLEVPTTPVDGSVGAWISATGDVFGLALQDLKNLITLPRGCGEQNCAYYVFNICAFLYLKATNQLYNAPTTAGSSALTVAEELITNMETGYRIQLLYKWSDGSYSAFGESSSARSGSTWLTAFVLKCYAQSQPTIGIPTSEIAIAANWLMGIQLGTGCFESIGKVVHTEMMGGIGGNGAAGLLTAFVTIALLEAGEDPGSAWVAHAVDCIENEATGSSNVYLLALQAYAYSLAGWPGLESLVQNLLDMSTSTADGVFWDIPSASGTTNIARSVETTSYVLLAILHLRLHSWHDESRQIVKWLYSNINSQGGFQSTQDTVMALQALSVYETLHRQGPHGLTVHVRGKGFGGLGFQISENNSLQLQRSDVSTLPDTIAVWLEGEGCALVQAVIQYHAHHLESSNAFNLSVSTHANYDAERCSNYTIVVCIHGLQKYLLNMLIIEVSLVSGYVPAMDDLLAIACRFGSTIKLYEVNGNKVIFYVESMIKEREICIKFNISRVTEVAKAIYGTVKAYDYYNPELLVSTTYSLNGCRK